MRLQLARPTGSFQARIRPQVCKLGNNQPLTVLVCVRHRTARAPTDRTRTFAPHQNPAGTFELSVVSLRSDGGHDLSAGLIESLIGRAT